MPSVTIEMQNLHSRAQHIQVPQTDVSMLVGIAGSLGLAAFLPEILKLWPPPLSATLTSLLPTALAASVGAGVVGMSTVCDIPPS